MDMSIVFLGSATCPHTPAMFENLAAALEKKGLRPAVETIDVSTLPDDDPRLGYGVPTVLVNGRDLFGLPAPLPAPARPG